MWKSIQLPDHKKLVLFDGVCNLCNTSVQQIIKRDQKNIFLFASLQSDLGSALSKELGFGEDQMGSIVLIEQHKFYRKSTAVLQISKDLSGLKWMSLFLVIPKFIRDAVYNLIAEKRYKWFGKREECMIPTPELKAKFLD